MDSFGAGRPIHIALAQVVYKQHWKQCRKWGNLHTTHVIQKGKRYIVGLQLPLHTNTWIKHYINQIQSRSDYGTKIKEDYPKCYTDPRSTPTGLHYWSTRTKQHKGQDLHRAPPELGCVICTDSSAPASWFWKYLWATGTQQSRTLAIKTI